MKKIAYIVFLLFCACYISSCSEDRYFPGEIYQDVDNDGDGDDGDVVEKVNENLAKGGIALSGPQGVRHLCVRRPARLPPGEQHVHHLLPERRGHRHRL